MLDHTVIYSLTANLELTEEIANILGINVSKCIVSHFADGEILCEPLDTVRDKDVYIIQSTCSPVTEHLFEILIFADALKRGSARQINLVVPYFGYARQDRKSKPRQPITSRLVADLIKVAGIDRVITVDLHAPQIQGFFSCLVDELTAIPLIADYFWKQNPNREDLVVVSPDHGGVNRARKVAEKLNVPLAIIDKRRMKPNEAEVMNIVGNVEGKHCIMIDDMVDTGGSCYAGAQALKKNGAKSIKIACTHPVFSKNAAARMLSDFFDEVVVTNSIPLRDEMKVDKVKVLSLAPMLAKVIEHVETGKPVSVVYDIYNHVDNDKKNC